MRRDLVIFVLGLGLGALFIYVAKLPVIEVVGAVWEIVNAIGNNTAATVAAIAALFAFVSGVLAPLVQWRVGRRQAIASQRSADAAMLAAQTAGAREIAKLRMSWMEQLRNTLSEYHSILMSTEGSDTFSAADDRKVSELGTQIDLLLNQKDAKQKRLWDTADKIFKLDRKSDRHALDEQLMEAGRDVLKEEWEKVKREMRGEGFQSGEKAITPIK